MIALNVVCFTPESGHWRCTNQCLQFPRLEREPYINASMIRSKYFVAKAINFFFDVYDSRFEVGDHRIIDRRMRERLMDFLLEDLLSLLEDRNVGLQHEALRLAKII
jgi:hypothetical protein